MLLKKSTTPNIVLVTNAFNALDNVLRDKHSYIDCIGVVRMVCEKKKIKGICTGLVVSEQGKSICGGIYPAVKKRECRMVPLTCDREVTETLAFANILAHVFIEVDQQREKKVMFER